MAVTGVGLQTSLYITLLLIFPPVISLFLFVALFLFHSPPLFLSDSSVFHLESLSSFFLLIVVASGAVVVLAVVIIQQKKKMCSQLFYFFSSLCQNIPPMLKGLDYFGVTSSAISFPFFLQNALWGRSSKSVLFSQHFFTIFCSDALWKCVTILTLNGGVDQVMKSVSGVIRLDCRSPELNPQFVSGFSHLPAVVGLNSFL